MYKPLSEDDSKALANPLVPKMDGPPDTIAFAIVDVAVPEAIVAPTKFVTEAEVNVAAIPASLASGQASPSESKSK